MILLTVVVLRLLAQVLHLYVGPLWTKPAILILGAKLTNWLGRWVRIVNLFIVIRLLRGLQILLIVTLVRTACGCLVWECVLCWNRLWVELESILQGRTKVVIFLSLAGLLFLLPLFL